MRLPLRFACLAGVCLAGLALSLAADTPSAPGLGNKGPLSPREEQATFKVPKGFRVELVASEPDVVDPVAMAFDEDGRLFIAEMRGYPNAGVGTGTITSGKIKLLEDTDGDGVYDKSTVYAEGLRFPMAVLPWRGGLLVGVAPDLIYLEDKDGDGKAEVKRVLYTGFDLANIQQMLNSLTYGMDNWVHGLAGSTGGSIRSAEKPGGPALGLNSRGLRFRPGVPGSLEPTSGGGQYGLTADVWGRWFVATNSQHLRHIVLPDHALRRNPSLPVRAVTLDIPDHGPACKVYRISPFEAWRVERTRRRKEGPDSARFATTELVPGGFSTSTCSPLIYEAGLFPAEYRGNVFVCDPANNLIHRDVLVPNGATFTAKRGDVECEFFASTDNWCRPVDLKLGPDGAMYFVDFYREVIETPLSLPDDIKKQLNLETRGRGRIWRIVPENAKAAPKPALRKASGAALVKHLANDNVWWRTTAQRLLFERQDKSLVQALEDMARQKKSAVGRAHALWTLDGMEALSEKLIEAALHDPEPGVREQAVRLAEERLTESPTLLAAVAKLADDPSPQVRFRLAIALGASESPERFRPLASIACRTDSDTWTQTAVLASCGKQPADLLAALLADETFLREAGGRHRATLTQLAALVGATGKDADLVKLFALVRVDPQAKTLGPVQTALLEGLGDGLAGTTRPLARLVEQPPASLAVGAKQARQLFDLAAVAAGDASANLDERLSAIRLLGHAPFGVAEPALKKLLSPREPAETQVAVIRALSGHAQPSVGELLLASWAGYSPAVRRECVEAVFARPERIAALLAGLEKKDVLGSQLEPVRLDQLRKHRDAEVRARAEKVLAGQVAPQRLKVVEAYQGALELKADRERGKAVFKKNCATCHRFENEGYEVGADLMAALKNKTPDQMLIDILDPSREVDPRFQNYIVVTTKGQTITGLIATETASSLTLRRGEKQEDVLLRTQIDEITATGKSVMPENLEMQLSKQDVADVIEYLLSVARK